VKLSVEQTGSIESEILKRVRAHPGISRIALARKLQIAPSTIGNYTGRLITQGFLAESEKMDFEAGRPPTALRLNPAGGYFIGVDFEARNIMAVSVDFADRPLKQVHENILESDSVEIILQKIEQAIIEVLPENPGQLLAIGVGVPGFVDPTRGVAIHYKYIKNWQNISLAAPLAKRFGVPVYLENNVRAMALAELWFGQGRGEENWACIGIRSGIGAGIVAGGKLLRGTNYRAGEIGRWLCPLPDLEASRFFVADAMSATAHYELQEIASVRAILSAFERAKHAGENSVLTEQPGPIIFAHVIRAAQQGDHLAEQIIQVAAESLGWAVAELTLVLNPSRIILSGPLTLLGEALLRPLRLRAQEILHVSGTDIPAIINSNMGEYNGALGAAALAVHEWKPVR
jgi:N-acetylglucosamine repressor